VEKHETFPSTSVTKKIWNLNFDNHALLFSSFSFLASLCFPFPNPSSLRLPCLFPLILPFMSSSTALQTGDSEEEPVVVFPPADSIIPSREEQLKELAKDVFHKFKDCIRKLLESTEVDFPTWIREIPTHVNQRGDMVDRKLICSEERVKVRASKVVQLEWDVTEEHICKLLDQEWGNTRLSSEFVSLINEIDPYNQDTDAHPQTLMVPSLLIRDHVKERMTSLLEHCQWRPGLITSATTNYHTKFFQPRTLPSGVQTSARAATSTSASASASPAASAAAAAPASTPCNWTVRFTIALEELMVVTPHQKSILRRRPVLFDIIMEHGLNSSRPEMPDWEFRRKQRLLQEDIEKEAKDAQYQQLIDESWDARNADRDRFERQMMPEYQSASSASASPSASPLYSAHPVPAHPLSTQSCSIARGKYYIPKGNSCISQGNSRTPAAAVAALPTSSAQAVAGPSASPLLSPPPPSLPAVKPVLRRLPLLRRSLDDSMVTESASSDDEQSSSSAWGEDSLMDATGPSASSSATFTRPARLPLRLRKRTSHSRNAVFQKKPRTDVVPPVSTLASSGPSSSVPAVGVGSASHSTSAAAAAAAVAAAAPAATDTTITDQGKKVILEMRLALVKILREDAALVSSFIQAVPLFSLGAHLNDGFKAFAYILEELRQNPGLVDQLCSHSMSPEDYMKRDRSTPT
jgi:hypothetical protein